MKIKVFIKYLSS